MTAKQIVFLILGMLIAGWHIWFYHWPNVLFHIFSPLFFKTLNSFKPFRFRTPGFQVKSGSLWSKYNSLKP